MGVDYNKFRQGCLFQYNRRMGLPAPLLAGRYYHIYLSARHPERLFADQAGYRLFLGLYAEMLDRHVTTFAYCLLPNHFHLFLRVGQLPLQFGPLLDAYVHGTGKTLQQPLLNITPVRAADNYRPLVRYIHQNPQLHGECDNFRVWRWSSYAALCGNSPTRLARRTVLRWFFNADWFEELHWEPQDETAIGYLILDD